MYSRNETIPSYAFRRHERITRNQTIAQILSRLADIELQHGHHATAEFLSHRAEQMRSDSDDQPLSGVTQ